MLYAYVITQSAERIVLDMFKNIIMSTLLSWVQYFFTFWKFKLNFVTFNHIFQFKEVKNVNKFQDWNFVISLFSIVLTFETSFPLAVGGHRGDSQS